MRTAREIAEATALKSWGGGVTAGEVMDYFEAALREYAAPLVAEIDRYAVLFAGLRDSAHSIEYHRKHIEGTAEQLRLDAEATRDAWKAK